MTRNSQRSLLSFPLPPPLLRRCIRGPSLPVDVVVRTRSVSIRTIIAACYWFMLLIPLLHPIPCSIRQPPNEPNTHSSIHPSIHSLPSLPPPISPSYISFHPLPLMPFRYCRCRRSVSSFSVLLVDNNIERRRSSALPCLALPGSIAAVESC